MEEKTLKCEKEPEICLLMTFEITPWKMWKQYNFWGVPWKKEWCVPVVTILPHGSPEEPYSY